MIYSGIFSAEKKNHPIPSIHTKMTGETTKSTGLSRCFSELVRGHFSKAKEHNPYGIWIFAFFVIQFVLRVLVNLALFFNLMKFNTIRLLDVSLSILLFIVCFKDFLWPFR